MVPWLSDTTKGALVAGAVISGLLIAKSPRAEEERGRPRNAQADDDDRGWRSSKTSPTHQTLPGRAADLSARPLLSIP